MAKAPKQIVKKIYRLQVDKTLADETAPGGERKYGIGAELLLTPEEGDALVKEGEATDTGIIKTVEAK